MRKALIGLMIAATAMTPIASASAQNGNNRNDRGNQRAERQEQRSERQEQRSQRQTQRSQQQTQRNAQQVQRLERRAAPAQRSFTPSQQGGNLERRVQRQVQPRAQGTPGQGFAQRRNGAQGSVERRREGRVQFAQPSQQVQSRQGNRDGRQWDRNRGNDNSRWNNNRTGNRTDWNRNRSGRWDGRNYNWNRNGRNFSWNHDWRSNRRYDWQNFRRSNRHIFNIGNYYAPYRGYRYNRFSIGFFLQPLFYSSNYWIGDPWQYRLPPAYPGTRWIRYYDDVLLVDTYTGEVIDVIYDFFW